MLIFKKIPEIMSEVGHIEKNRKNQAQGYAFRGIDDLYSAMQPLLAKHGVFYSPNILRETREERQSKSGGTMIYTILTVEYTFYAEDGSKFTACTVGEAMDSGDKSANKAMSAALKYALLQIFCIPTQEDNDTENHSPEVAPRSGPTTQPASKPAEDFPRFNPPKSGPSLQAVPSDPGSYVIGFGKHKGKNLEQVGPHDLDGYIKWMRSDAAEKGKPLSGVGLETVNAAEAFLKSRETQRPAK